MPFADFKTIFDHSCLATERIFGNIEKELRKQQLWKTMRTITSSLTVKQLDQEWVVINLKTFLPVLKKKLKRLLAENL